MTRAPEPEAPADARRLAWLAVALSIVAGATNVFSFMQLGRVFTSVMTGNLVLLGMGIGTGAPAQIANTGVALAGYLVGVAGGARAAKPHDGVAAVWPRSVSRALCIEFAVFVALLGGWEVVEPHPAGWQRLLLLAGAAAAMGVQGAATRQVRVNGLSTTYFTSTLTGVIEEVFLPARKVQAHSIIQLIGLAGGAAAGALLTASAAPFALVLQCGLLAAVIGSASWPSGPQRRRMTQASASDQAPASDNQIFSAYSDDGS